MKTLIAFFSRADENYFGGQYRYIDIGNTEIAVNLIRRQIEADCFRIEMKQPYSPVYRECVGQAAADFKANARPALAATLPSIAEYDNVILAYPCYCGTVPMAVMTFLEQYNWNGKTILPLCTHEGSGMGRSPQSIQSACPGADIRFGLPVLGSTVDDGYDYIGSWLRDNGLL